MTSGDGQKSPPRVLYVVGEDWYFLSHRLPMARAARDAGFEVHVATNVTHGATSIAAEGFALHAVPFARGRLSPVATWRTIAALRRVQRDVRPALVHHVSLQPTMLGLLAMLGRRTACVNAVTGLGFAFTSGTAKARLLRPLLRPMMRMLLNRERTVSLVQNPDDRDALAALGIEPRMIRIIPGSGVDTDRLPVLPEPEGVPTVAFVGRLLVDKGIRTLIDAHRLLRARGSNVQLLIAGTPDPANPASIPADEVMSWGREPGITWLGHVDHIADVWARAHVAVLPSYREGLPLSLLEAAACGRSMIATDVPGCREVVVSGETGLLTPVDEPVALADAIEHLAQSPALRRRYGETARRRVETRFSSRIIGQETVALYRELVGDGPL